MMKWGAQQAETLVTVTFQCWKDDHYKMKEDAALEAMNDKMKELSAKGDATLQKTMMKWGAQQAEQLVSITFQSWKDDLAEVKAEKQMLKMLERNEAVFRKTMLKLERNEAVFR